MPKVALYIHPSEDPAPFVRAIEHAKGQAVLVQELSGAMPSDAGGLMLAGEQPLEDVSSVPSIVKEAIDRQLPVLGIGWGMHALNVELGGGLPEPCDDHGQPGEASKHPVFIAPGGKISYTIAGSGWVTAPSTHTHALRPGQVADGLLSSVYADDQVIEAIEKPGREWLIGVQWPAQDFESTPKGFDSLLLALVERSDQ